MRAGAHVGVRPLYQRMAARLAFFLGIALLGVAGGVFVVDAVGAIQGGGFRISALGDLLFALKREALDQFQTAIQGHVSPALWDRVIAWILRLPAVLVFGLPGLALVSVAPLRRRAVHGRQQSRA